MSDLLFASTAALEKALDGSDEEYNRYYFALYHCLPDEDAPLNDRRHELKNQHPDKAVSVGRHFILFGEPAYQVLRSYYYSLSTETSLPKEFREYAREMQSKIEERHRSSQELPVPIDLSEGQLNNDERLEFYTCLAISNGQIINLKK